MEFPYESICNYIRECLSKVVGALALHPGREPTSIYYKFLPPPPVVVVPPPPQLAAPPRPDEHATTRAARPGGAAHRHLPDAPLAGARAAQQAHRHGAATAPAC